MAPRTRVGHAPTINPYGGKNPVMKVLLSPLRLYHYLIYETRPDVVHGKTRQAHWQALRSPWRWAHAIFAYLGPPSHLLWHIKVPLAFNLAIAALIMLVSYLQLTDLGKVSSTMATSLFWRLSSFMLALLLAFRVGRTYERWWQARQAFSGVGSAALSIASLATIWVDDPLIREEIRRWCLLWQPSVHHYVTYSTLEAVAPSAAALLDPDELALYNSAHKPRNLVTVRLRQLIHLANPGNGRLERMEATMSDGIAAQGTCGRILFQAMPYSVTLVCTGFVEVWLLILPLALFGSDRDTAPGHNYLELLLYALVCVLLLGVDEAAAQLELPFPFLPLAEIAKSTWGDIQGLPETARRLQELGAARLCPQAHLKDREVIPGSSTCAAAAAAAAAAASGNGAATCNGRGAHLALHIEHVAAAAQDAQDVGKTA